MLPGDVEPSRQWCARSRTGGPLLVFPHHDPPRTESLEEEPYPGAAQQILLRIEALEEENEQLRKRIANIRLSSPHGRSNFLGSNDEHLDMPCHQGNAGKNEAWLSPAQSPRLDRPGHALHTMHSAAWISPAASSRSLSPPAGFALQSTPAMHPAPGIACVQSSQAQLCTAPARCRFAETMHRKSQHCIGATNNPPVLITARGVMRSPSPVSTLRPVRAAHPTFKSRVPARASMPVMKSRTPIMQTFTAPSRSLRPQDPATAYNLGYTAGYAAAQHARSCSPTPHD